MRHPPIDVAWTLICGILVFLMQAGFMCLEAGFVRQKNSINVAIKNVTDFLISSVAFFAVGFALMFGASANGWIGTDGFFLSKYIASDAEGWIFPFWFFQDMFCGTASTIVAGGVAERIRYRGYMWVSFTVAAILYPVFGHWAWGGGYDLAPQKGWLAAMGYKDFAGSSVVHMVGGTATLACLAVLGPRKGRYNPDGSTNRIWGSDIPMAALGVFLLWIGWFGFNGGSTLAMNRSVAPIIINTNLAACTGALFCMAWAWFYKGQPEVEAVLNGALAGLVAITAPCAYVSPISAMVIGVLGGVAMNLMDALLHRLRIDDAVGAIPVHLGAGIMGVLCVGLFAREEFLVGGSRIQQVGVQALGVAVCFVFTFVVEWLLVAGFDRFISPLRVSAADEEEGLNLSEHGARTLWLDLAQDMSYIERSHDLTRRAIVEPETEAGVVARIFNSMMGTLEDRTRALDKKSAEVAAANAQMSAVNKRLIQKTRENEMFVYSVSHDLRSPLVNLMGFSKELGYAGAALRGALQRGTMPDAERQAGLALLNDGIDGSLRFIHTAVARMNDMTDGLLRLSRTGAVKYRWREVDLTATVQRIVDAMHLSIAERGATVHVGTLPHLWGDPNAVEQVFANLIANAVNYLDPRQPGVVEVGCQEGGVASAQDDARFHRLYVKDNGLGIPKAFQEKVFRVFQRLHPHHVAGVGIGLSIVRRIVERHQGAITVDSTEGVGSTFWVDWPIQRVTEDDEPPSGDLAGLEAYETP